MNPVLEQIMQMKEFQDVLTIPDEVIPALGPIERDLARRCKLLAKMKADELKAEQAALARKTRREKK